MPGRRTGESNIFLEILVETVLEVQSGRISAYRAAKDFKIPLNTVTDHVNGRRGRKSTSHGRPTAFPLDVEKKIAACVITMVQHRFVLSRKNILSLVGEYVPTKEEAAFPGTSHVATENECMETEVSINFFKIAFLAHIGTERPVLEICDGHKTHGELDPNIIKSGFRKGGIYLFSQDKIPEEWFDKQRLHLWNQINRSHLQARSSNEGSVVSESVVVQAGSSIDGYNKSKGRRLGYKEIFIKKNIKHYVGQVIRFEYGDPIMKYTRKVLTKENAAAFKFPDGDYISSIDITDIIRALSPPKIGRRGEAIFSIDLTTLNV
ncbi:hypothetical protein PR048_020160 [Dryococelus australis]|uniref:HTH psq-type domain-containing protein n=1 Tax=Dryococelus australis TaxID=614101 RepID=A0ABQ9H5M3_9NEOP|nr:hypothetical protein PR048_020160 [Dryococelus australis]